MAYAPAAELVAPVANPPIPDLVNNILGAKQYISPSYWIGWIVQQVCGTNPWEWVIEQYTGDWHAAAEASDALKNLADFNRQYALAIESEGRAVFGDEWQGHAADAAKAYFDGIVKTLHDQVAALESISGQFHSLTAGMQEAAQGLQSLFQDLTDLVIVAAISAAATAASSWTVVGGIAGALATAASIAAAVEVWYAVLSAHDAAWAGVQVFTGLVAGYLGGLQGMEQHALPGSAYNHPGV
ncbi:hypothetical protein F4553_004148 [Allocatelliglobosispora scoriae]|uniref:WXG100 family type VII secretion target n=1 Tax=Allocatelliglobosispora scoriae TaxID=643052 RepID=A0A841BUD4_9ACTN|nr:hypothetical protein [Allocatelliglobosispora scoriae]MBB5870769.1 hypothetical protein [Allocatelliglobosispora scoriae]